MDMNDVGLLSVRLIKSKNYSLCKRNVDELMYKFEECIYKHHNINPPKITQSYEIKYDSFTNSISNPTASYVTKKIETEEEINALYQELANALKLLCKSELIYFKNCYYNRLSDSLIGDIMNIGKDMVRRIKESAVIKIAMYFGIDE